ncbi:MAG TPA: DNA primase [Bacteroidales bacterium]|nr:DNA primase [Bacteroidales bacterium]
MIDQATIDKIVDTARIEDVIQDFLPLKRRGVNMIGLCPFHNEKTPSFTVSPAKGIFKCFGCGKGGNSVHFIMEHEQLDWLGAIKYLAKKYRIEVEERELSEEEKLQGSERESMMIVNAFAQKYFSTTLTENEEGIAIGLSYFRERGFHDNIIEKFQLGYCPDGRNKFTEHALKNGYKLEYLEKTGLTIVKENFTSDRYSGRVIFPIQGISGRVIAFGGRTLKTDKTVAKYVNSPESLVYHKSQTLYGIYQSKNAIIRENKTYLVEGYTDVISLHQAGIENVVASSGTSLTREQIALIRRFSENVTILYDGDPAGIKASLRGIDMLLEEGLNIKVLLFPDGEDPDSFARKHNYTSLIKYFAENEQDFIHFKLKLLSEDAMNDPVKRSAMISDIVRSVSVIGDNIKRNVYLQECSRLLDIDESTLFRETAKYRKKQFEDKRKQEERENLRNQVNITPPLPGFVTDEYCESHEKELIRLLLLFGNHRILLRFSEGGNMHECEISIADYIIQEIRNDELELKNLIYQKIFLEAEKLLKLGKIPSADLFVKHADPDISINTANICTQGYELSTIWDKRYKKSEPEEKQLSEIVPKLILTYKRKIVEQNLDKKRTDLRKIQSSGDLDKISEISTEIAQLDHYKNQISKMYNQVILR